ncbi:MAG: class I SAM-dependent methyltransferase [Solirubrobacteraceae bacterium]
MARVTAETFGRFDAVARLGAFEHFCSVEDYHAGRQDQIYTMLFENIAGMLPPGGRLYLQTMVFGPRMIPIDEVSIDAPRESDAWYLALMTKQFPGSFLPFGQEQVIKAIAPTLRLVSSISGRLDYIETIRQWRQRFAQPSSRKRLMKLKLVPRWAGQPRFPPRLHLRRERQQRLLRARTARALPPRVRETCLGGSDELAYGAAVYVAASGRATPAGRSNDAPRTERLTRCRSR